MASEKKQRELSNELITTEIAAELAPFTHKGPGHGSGEVVKPCAMAYVPNLTTKITELLEQLDR